MSDGAGTARQAVEAGDWQRALDLLAGDAPDDDVEVLELRAQAHYGNGDFEASVQAWEDLHALHLLRDDIVGAAQAAATIAMYLMMDTGLMAPVRGWIRVAQRLLAGHAPTSAHALVAISCAYERLMCGDLPACRDHAAAAISIGTETGFAPAVVIGRVAAARVRIFDGDMAGGVAELDEVGALLMTGVVDPLTTGMMYCELICAAQGLGLHDRATEWTDVMERWRHGAAFGGINGRCRVHRAELLRVSGPCDAAEAEALEACEELRPWMRREFGWPLVELGNIRLRRGDLAGAEDAFLDAQQHAWSPQPGLALLRLAQGDAAVAAVMIADAIDHPFDVPWKERPPVGDLRVAPLLDAQAEIAFATGDAEVAAHAAERLGQIAASYPSTFNSCWAALAASRAMLLRQEADDAIEAARRAVTAWTEIGAPYEAAAGRVLLGRAHQVAGDATSARTEWQAARSAFARFGAGGRAAEVASLLEAAPRVTAPAAGPPANTVQFVAKDAMRIVEFGDLRVTIGDLKGFRYIARLVAEPGREFHALDLVAAEEGVLRSGPLAGGDELPHEATAQRGLPVLDDAARESYRRRLAEVEEDIDDARNANDPGRVELAERDREYLIAELRRAVGLAGRVRHTGGSAERARTSVTRSIRYAIKQLDDVEQNLAGHLAKSVRTGIYVRYEPDPIAPLRWILTSQ